MDSTLTHKINSLNLKINIFYYYLDDLILESIARNLCSDIYNTIEISFFINKKKKKTCSGCNKTTLQQLAS